VPVEVIAAGGAPHIIASWAYVATAAPVGATSLDRRLALDGNADSGATVGHVRLRFSAVDSGQTFVTLPIPAGGEKTLSRPTTLLGKKHEAS